MSGLSCGRKRNLGRHLFDSSSSGGQFLNVGLKDLGRGNAIGGGGGGGIGSHIMVSRTLSPFRVVSLYQASTLPMHPGLLRYLIAGTVPYLVAQWQTLNGMDGACAL